MPAPKRQSPKNSPQNDCAVLLVSGFLNELLCRFFLGRYMRVVQKQLLSAGFPHVELLEPSSLLSSEQAAPLVAEAIARLQEKSQKPVLVIAHSKACIDLLFAVLDPNTLGKCAGLIFQQGPFGGSQLVDWLFHLPLVRPFLLKGLQRRWIRGLLSLLPGHYAPELERRLAALTPEALAELENKSVAFSSYVEDAKPLHFLLRLPHSILRRLGANSWRNDGLVSFEHQKLPFRPRQHFFAKLPHAHFTCEKPLGAASANERERFFTSLMQICLRQKEAESLEYLHLLGVHPMQYVPSLGFDKPYESLSVASFNAGLLPIPVFGIPFVEERSKFLRSTLEQNQNDLYALQEVFPPEARERLQKSESYFSYGGPASFRHGLFLQVKKSLLLQEPEAKDCFSYFFTEQRKAEPLTGFYKGVIGVKLRLQAFPDEPVFFLNTHLTAFANASRIRTEQLEELKRVITSFTAGISQGWIILAGDFNEAEGRMLQSLGLVGFQEVCKKPVGESFSYTNSLNQLKPKILQEDAGKIDHIFVCSIGQEAWKVKNVSLELQKAFVPCGKRKERRELSDHYMLRSELYLKRRTGEGA